MFIKWDDAKKRAYTTITLMITAGSNGASFILKNSDSLTFSMEFVTLQAIDSKNRIWSVNTPRVVTESKYVQIEKRINDSYFVSMPFSIDKSSGRSGYRLDGKVIKEGNNWRTIAISPGENKCY